MKNPSRQLIDSIRRIAGDSVCQAPDDAVLLDQFVNNHDEAAFEVLLRRYESMVAGVCRRLLPNPLEAQDAVQVTFLALVCRAKDLHVSGRGIGGWLYQVAVRSARKMRDANRRAMLREKTVARPESVVDPVPSCQQIESVIYEELGLLPEKYRLALVMCCILNRSLADAGAEIGISAPAMWKRVQKGREILRKRLVRRGFEVTTAAVAVVLAATTAAGAVVPSAIPSVAALFGCQSARLGALAEETAAAGGRHLVGWSLLASFVAVAVGLAGVLVAVSWPRPADQPASNQPEARGTVPATPVVAAVPVEAKPLVPARPPLAELIGVVRDGESRPVPFARITVLARTSKFGESSICDDVLTQARADGEGRYRVIVPYFRANPAEDRTLKVVATAADSPTHNSTIRLVTVRSGVAIEPVDIALQPSRRAVGRVVDAVDGS